MRVFSHTCSNTEIVCALGCGDQLIGVDADSDYPPEIVSRLPQPGRDLDLDTGAVLALQPDLVLTSLTVPGHERIVDEFKAMGLKTITIDPQSLDDVFASIATIADVLEVSERGAHLIRQMRAQMPAVGTRHHRPRILVEWWPKPVIVPARRSWVTDIIELAGGCNPCGDIDAKSWALPDDDHQTYTADAIVMSWCGVQQSKYRPEIVRRREHWRHWPALSNNQIYAVTEAWLGRPGPRLVEGYAALRRIIEAL
ncbi:ABC transporter substrate-binding protein [Hydrocarboniphaga sp.]|uniref:ABC transporter substrate-binding protein n=1 Tax=Hydrocarboniphaga sp. TaxID=2033016 RepID=UPI00260A904A|nr:ABC transporter substrate-binding protein [Hydrocarboniphaga sp.]